MDLVVKLPYGEVPQTLSEVVSSLKAQKLKVRLESKNWGDWIYLIGKETTISIESNNGLTSTATIEIPDHEVNQPFQQSILAAFRSLGWIGEDEDGEFAL